MYVHTYMIETQKLLINHHQLSIFDINCPQLSSIIINCHQVNSTHWWQSTLTNKTHWRQTVHVDDDLHLLMKSTLVDDIHICEWQSTIIDDDQESFMMIHTHLCCDVQNLWIIINIQWWLLIAVTNHQSVITNCHLLQLLSITRLFIFMK